MHYSLLLITTTDDACAVRDALQPFHQYEVTGIDDKYVVDVDRTAELRPNYDTDTTLALIDTDGVIYGVYDARFWRDPTLPNSNELAVTDTGVCKICGTSRAIGVEGADIMCASSVRKSGIPRLAFR